MTASVSCLIQLPNTDCTTSYSVYRAEQKQEFITAELWDVGDGVELYTGRIRRHDNHIAPMSLLMPRTWPSHNLPVLTLGLMSQ